MRQKELTEIITIRLNLEMKKQLDSIAKNDGRDMANMIRRILQEHIDSVRTK